ncbi:MAG: helix-turn-helix domain-containing protein [bacterium]|nr:helix-turn-helix domain-containing protein [bacterium]
MTDAVLVVERSEQARTLLHETRLEILRRLAEPESATSLATAMELPRQRLNYHLQALAAQGLVEVVHQGQRGSVRQRTYRRAGTGYAIAATALGSLGSRPEQVQDRFSAAYQIAVANRAIADLARLRAGAEAAGQRLSTMSLEVDVRFRSAADRSAFAQELTDTIAALARKYHDDEAEAGRTFQFYLGAYPQPQAAGGTAGGGSDEPDPA